ncbi:uncharacterized protein LOC143226527 isoform X1 [Tachypleus tridentatus]|uniref:uncharacterized protein LOC143226527 isoform X1 n=1 Tax=Tachypleus tridentatus TaxID=6853 RepID=UPI003FD0C9FF
MLEMRKIVFKAHIITYIVIVKILCSSGHNYKQDESTIASSSISSNTNNDVKTKREFSGRAKIPTKEEMNQWFGPTDEVRNGWVDPHVMFDYDRNAINRDRINNIKRYTDETQFQDEDLKKNDKGDVKSNENLGEIKNNTKLCNCHNLQNDLNNCKKSILENTKGFCKCEYIYLKRLVNKLLNKFKPFDFKLKNSREIQINVRLSSNYIEAFNLFVEYPDKYIYELDQNLSELISRSTVSEQHVIKESWLEFVYRVIWLSELTIPVLCFFGFVLLKVHFMNKSWFQIIVRSLAIIFIVSFCIDWIYLYKVQLAKKHASLSHGSVPEECSTSDMTWWQSLKAWFKSGLTVEENPCEKYYKSILVDPFWEVTPLMALSESISKFVLHPAGLLGTHIGRFTRLLYLEIPSFLWLPVTVFIFIIVCLIFVVCFGYRVHFPFFLGTLEPVYRNTEALHLPARLLSKVSMETLTPRTHLLLS